MPAINLTPSSKVSFLHAYFPVSYIYHYRKKEKGYLVIGSSFNLIRCSGIGEKLWHPKH